MKILQFLQLKLGPPSVDDGLVDGNSIAIIIRTPHPNISIIIIFDIHIIIIITVEVVTQRRLQLRNGTPLPISA